MPHQRTGCGHSAAGHNPNGGCRGRPQAKSTSVYRAQAARDIIEPLLVILGHAELHQPDQALACGPLCERLYPGPGQDLARAELPVSPHDLGARPATDAKQTYANYWTGALECSRFSGHPIRLPAD